MGQTRYAYFSNLSICNIANIAALFEGSCQIYTLPLINRVFLQNSKNYITDGSTHCLLYITPSSSHRSMVHPSAKIYKNSNKNKGVCSSVGVNDTQGGVWFGMDLYPKKTGCPNLYG